MEKIAEIIKRARKDANMTQKTAAEKSNIPFSTFRMYENGTAMPPADKFLAILQAMGASPEKYLAEYLPSAFDGLTDRQMKIISDLIEEIKKSPE